MDAIYYGAIISTITILVNLFISLRTIHTNREIQKENAGKNRTIYDVVVLGTGSANLKILLDTGNYTILNAYGDPANCNDTIIILGRIRP